MGNYLSCTLAITGGIANAKAIKVVLPSNEVQRLDGPMTAAELMLDMPGHFLVSSKSMHVGRRFMPLSADEELEISSSVYVMFPMNRVNSMVGAPDMARLLLVANKEVRQSSAGGSKVIPERLPDSEGSKMKLEEMLNDNEDEMVVKLGELKYRLSLSRSRKPTLETIQE